LQFIDDIFFYFDIETVTFSVASSLDESELARKIVYGWEEGIVQVLR
jgi:hypothetical protein